MQNIPIKRYNMWNENSFRRIKISSHCTKFQSNLTNNMPSIILIIFQQTAATMKWNGIDIQWIWCWMKSWVMDLEKRMHYCSNWLNVGMDMHKLWTIPHDISNTLCSIWLVVAIYPGRYVCTSIPWKLISQTQNSVEKKSIITDNSCDDDNDDDNIKG